MGKEIIVGSSYPFLPELGRRVPSLVSIPNKHTTLQTPSQQLLLENATCDTALMASSLTTLNYFRLPKTLHIPCCLKFLCFYSYHSLCLFSFLLSFFINIIPSSCPSRPSSGDISSLASVPWFGLPIYALPPPCVTGYYLPGGCSMRCVLDSRARRDPGLPDRVIVVLQ